MPTHSSSRRILSVATAGVIAALYVVLTYPFAQFAYGPIQFRLAEIMVVLAILTPAAIPGLTVGCLLANLMNPSGLGLVDVIFGSLATLIAAVLTRRIAVRASRLPQTPRDLLSLSPPVLVNALIVGTYLPFLLTQGPVTIPAVLISIAYLAASETLVVYLLGFPFLTVLRRTGVQKIWEERQ